MRPEPATGTIELDDVSVTVDGRRILADVTLALHAKRIAVIGANGSGKSTFLRLLNGLIAPITGTVRVHGLDVSRQTASLRI